MNSFGLWRSRSESNSTASTAIPTRTKNACSLEIAASPRRRDDLREHADDKQISAGQQQRERSVQNGAGRIDVDLAETAPQITDRDQGAANQQRAASMSDQSQARVRKREAPDCACKCARRK